MSKQVKVNTKDIDTKKLDKALKDVEDAMAGPWAEATKAWQSHKGTKTAEKALLFQRLVKITEAIHGDNH